MRYLIVPGALLIGIAGCTNTPYVETHRNVSYYASDWSRIEMQGRADTPPHPEGGMRAFTARLDYPADLRRRHVVGVMTVRVSLDASGHVLTSRVIQSVHPELDAIVLRAVRETRWMPATRAGKPVPIRFKFPVTFRV